MKWYSSGGKNFDVVLSTRVRLARNLEEYPFPARLNSTEKKKVNELLKDILLAAPCDERLEYIEMESFSRPQAVSLAEKHLISPEFAYNGEGGALILSENEDISIMLCEEDHARIQTILPGLALEEAYQKAAVFDRQLEENAAVAFDKRLGYLTQCPTNLGTGMRASVLLHLPALSGAAASRLAATVARLGMTLRPAFGEENRALGDIFQLSNQVTLGISEQAALQNLNAIALQIAEQEKQARAALLKDDAFIDKIWRSWGILKSAHIMSFREFAALFSLVRLGAAEGILEAKLDSLGELLIKMQPATVCAESGKNMTARERDVFRAQSVKKALE